MSGALRGIGTAGIGMKTHDMKGTPRPGHAIVSCNCNGIKASGTFEVCDRFLVLTSPFGTVRVALGVQAPRKLATKLLRNLCLTAAVQKEAKAQPEAATVAELM